jgi:hypothetical protein
VDIVEHKPARRKKTRHLIRRETMNHFKETKRRKDDNGHKRSCTGNITRLFNGGQNDHVFAPNGCEESGEADDQNRIVLRRSGNKKRVTPFTISLNREEKRNFMTCQCCGPLQGRRICSPLAQAQLSGNKRELNAADRTGWKGRFQWKTISQSSELQGQDGSKSREESAVEGGYTLGATRYRLIVHKSHIRLRGTPEIAGRPEETTERHETVRLS